MPRVAGLHITDGLVSFLDEEFDGFNGAVVQVAAHGMHIGHVGHAVEEDNGDVIALHLLEVVDLGGVLGYGGQDAVDPVLLHGLEDPFFIL